MFFHLSNYNVFPSRKIWPRYRRAHCSKFHTDLAIYPDLLQWAIHQMTHYTVQYQYHQTQEFCSFLYPEIAGLKKFLLARYKQKKYTLKLVSKIVYSRSALEVKHNTVFSLLCILSLNRRVVAVRPNMVTGNSKKLQQLFYRQARSEACSSEESHLQQHYAALQIQYREGKPLNSSIKEKNLRACNTMVSHSSTDRFHGNFDVQLGRKSTSQKKVLGGGFLLLHWIGQNVRIAGFLKSSSDFS